MVTQKLSSITDNYANTQGEEASAGTASVVLSTPKLMMPARTAAMLFFQFN